MYKFYYLLLLFIFPAAIFAQHQEISEKPLLWKGNNKPASDSGTLRHAFKQGKVQGHFRYFFMSTQNERDLSDYYAHALGGGIKYETGKFKGFQFGVSGFYIFNIAASNLSIPDAKTGQMNRYETGLFDIEHPESKHIDRLEELYLKYSWKNNHITFGKQLINTPFLNLQDGRMRPSETEGAWVEINSIKKLHLEAGYLYRFSPRSTTEWYSTAEAIGVYPSGVNSKGNKSDYKGNLSSKGVLLLGLQYKATPQLQLKWWEVFTENIFNTSLFQADFNGNRSGQHQWTGGVQLIHQFTVNDGGNADASKTYMDKGAQSLVIGTKAGWNYKNISTSINYTRITAKGRYLMPREWGRDPFYTFLPRERNEGFGDVHAFTLKAGIVLKKAGLKIENGWGYYQLPDVMHHRLNKYGLPSYFQNNTDIRYTLKGALEGLETQLLFVWKDNKGNIYQNDRYVINKVNMYQWNLVFNYHF